MRQVNHCTSLTLMLLLLRGLTFEQAARALRFFSLCDFDQIPLEQRRLSALSSQVVILRLALSIHENYRDGMSYHVMLIEEIKWLNTATCD